MLLSVWELLPIFLISLLGVCKGPGGHLGLGLHFPGNDQRGSEWPEATQLTGGATEVNPWAWCPQVNSLYPFPRCFLLARTSPVSKHWGGMMMPADNQGELQSQGANLKHLPSRRWRLKAIWFLKLTCPGPMHIVPNQPPLHSSY